MNISEILIRYGELTTKGRNRRQFIDRLRQNIYFALNEVTDYKIVAERDRMFIRSENHDTIQTIVQKLPNIFGIQSFSPVVSCEKDLEVMKETAVQLVQSIDLEEPSFKVSVKRADKSFPLETNELQYEIGSYVLRNTPNLHVQMKKPDIELRVEVRHDAIYMMAEVIPGAGGMPVGSNGKTMLMLSGGIDSPVAGYMLMKRGVAIEAIHFHSPPFTSEQSKKKVIDLCEKLSGFGTKVKLHIIPFTDIQKKIHAQIPDNVTMTATRRAMLQIADQLREQLNLLGITTGESLGQVASQTLESLTAINAVTNTPILRPLISMDKLDIIEIAHQIDTYDISIRPYEDCCTIFTPASPKTKPKLEKITFYESFYSLEEEMKQAIEEREVISFPRKKEKSEIDDLL